MALFFNLLPHLDKKIEEWATKVERIQKKKTQNAKTLQRNCEEDNRRGKNYACARTQKTEPHKIVYNSSPQNTYLRLHATQHKSMKHAELYAHKQKKNTVDHDHRQQQCWI